MQASWQSKVLQALPRRHDDATLPLTTAREIPPLHYMSGKSHQLHPSNPNSITCQAPSSHASCPVCAIGAAWGGFEIYGGHDALGAGNDVGSRQPRRRRWPRRSWRRWATQSPAMQSQGDAIARRCNRKRCNRRAMQARPIHEVGGSQQCRSRAVPAVACHPPASADRGTANHSVLTSPALSQTGQKAQCQHGSVLLSCALSHLCQKGKCPLPSKGPPLARASRSAAIGDVLLHNLQQALSPAMQ